jgi:hypothetical protein
MANNTTYTWKFPTLQAYTQKDGYTDVVYVVHWYYTGTRTVAEGTGSKEYQAQIYGAQQIAPYESGSRDFIPFSDLTEATVQSWVEESFGAERIQQMQTGLDGQIDNLINPPVVYLPAPWTVPTPTPSPMPEPTPTPTE